MATSSHPFAMHPLADRLSAAKSEAVTVLEAWPADADGRLDLEHAIELLGRCETELDHAKDREDGTA